MIASWINITTPGVYTLPPITPGADWDVFWDSYDSSGNLVNFVDTGAGYTALAMIRGTPTSPNPAFLTFSTSPSSGQGLIQLGGLTVGVTAGRTVLKLTNALTATLAGGFTGQWDIFYSSGDVPAIVTPLLTGVATTRQPIT